MTLEGRPFRLLAYADADGRLAAVPDGVEVTAAFEDGQVSGKGGCNRYMGPYQRDGDRIALGPLASTMMACPEPAMSVEAGFHAAASRVTATRGPWRHARARRCRRPRGPAASRRRP